MQCGRCWSGVGNIQLNFKSNSCVRFTSFLHFPSNMCDRFKNIENIVFSQLSSAHVSVRITYQCISNINKKVDSNIKSEFSRCCARLCMLCQSILKRQSSNSFKKKKYCSSIWSPLSR